MALLNGGLRGTQIHTLIPLLSCLVLVGAQSWTRPLSLELQTRHRHLAVSGVLGINATVEPWFSVDLHDRGCFTAYQSTRSCGGITPECECLNMAFLGTSVAGVKAAVSEDSPTRAVFQTSQVFEALADANTSSIAFNWVMTNTRPREQMMGPDQLKHAKFLMQHSGMSKRNQRRKSFAARWAAHLVDRLCEPKSGEMISDPPVCERSVTLVIEERGANRNNAFKIGTEEGRRLSLMLMVLMFMLMVMSIVAIGADYAKLV